MSRQLTSASTCHAAPTHWPRSYRGKAEPSSGHASTPPARPSGISIQSKIGVATLRSKHVFDQGS